MGLLEAILIQSAAYAVVAFLGSRKEGFEQGYGIFIVLSSIAASIFSWGSLLDYIMALEWYENLFWLFQIPILLISFLYVPLSIFILFIVFFYIPQQLFLVLKGKPKLVKFLSTTFAVIIGFVAIWWFYPTKDDICQRLYDGRYTEKQAAAKWIMRGGRYGSGSGLIGTCRYKGYLK